MKEEIKEILDNIRKIIKSNRENDFNRIIYDCDGIEKILDYITNLQEEVEKLKQPQIFIDTMDMEERYGQELYEDYLKEKLEDYKQRNEKAIYKLQDIIESNNGALSNSEHLIIGKHSLLKLENDNCYILLNILKGDEEDN